MLLGEEIVQCASDGVEKSRSSVLARQVLGEAEPSRTKADQKSARQIKV